MRTPPQGVKHTLGTTTRDSTALRSRVSNQPSGLFLDENMAGLNPAETEETIRLIRKINESGVTILLIEHIMRAVVSLCEKVIVLHHGEKIAEGTPEYEIGGAKHYRDNTYASAAIAQVQGQEWKTVWPFEFASSKIQEVTLG